MKYITRKQFDGFVQNPEKINTEDLIYILEEKLGFSVSIEEKPQLTKGQKKQMTDYIFSNQDVLSQLKKATKRDYIYSDEEALKVIHGAQDEE